MTIEVQEDFSFHKRLVIRLKMWIHLCLSAMPRLSMPRQPRELKPEYCYHITVRCNNREFRLTRFECREVLLYAMSLEYVAIYSRQSESSHYAARVFL